MPRPKGSKNKPKSVEEIAKEVVSGKKDILTAAVEVMDATSPAKWTPTPNMGDVKEPPREDKKCAGCDHIGVLHYGGPASWCNRTGCNCQGFK